MANYEYDAWGNVLKSEAKGIAAENPFGYAGYMYDKEIGMYYLIARYYNPTHGVFLSVELDGHWEKWYQVSEYKMKWSQNKRFRYAVKSGVKGVINSYKSDVGYVMASSAKCKFKI
nr:RHS repeat-associated core domain-containing protein [Bacillus sp. 123MFChir2]